MKKWNELNWIEKLQAVINCEYDTNWNKLNWIEKLYLVKNCDGDKNILQQAILDDHIPIREQAVRLCQRDRDILLKGLQDKRRSVQNEVLKQLKDEKDILDLVRGTLVHRTFEPPEKVYKKCRYGVIVVAEIPKDAFVRGNFDQKCRANKARIIDVMRVDGKTLCCEVSGRGVHCGVSHYDEKTVYHVCDDIYISDFDYSNAECSTGFHFFCTLQEAILYTY